MDLIWTIEKSDGPRTRLVSISLSQQDKSLCSQQLSKVLEQKTSINQYNKWPWTNQGWRWLIVTNPISRCSLLLTDDRDSSISADTSSHVTINAHDHAIWWYRHVTGQTDGWQDAGISSILADHPRITPWPSLSWPAIALICDPIVLLITWHTGRYVHGWHVGHILMD